MELEQRSKRSLDKFTVALTSRGRRVIEAVDKGAIEDVVSLWKEYTKTERLGLHYKRSDPEAYADVVNSLKGWLFGYMENRGFNPNQLCRC